ncbi:UDP-N-acetylmuramoyl-L-alanyl-D-glutamate--2,6-diaminopimelate ligase [uncultured Paludibaculum sp.]|uniref:UDP-N-acetylmuramoyl-L-alanyl-D-glutamate--2, 6-diaminopimelate ligase n=1 Tax=uncultured Paludibaculum sp. TaxID=1765020 RepID=UPI002AAA7CBF|nr:UDP-N-acetylmuramoyl-L-alanyl-D-glutamate--2,6-diaminopimelate ligase [uncultured Paludibaculum sp.]
MRLADLLEGVPVRSALPPGADTLDVSGLDYDSRRVKPGFLFFAFPGAKADGRAFAVRALEAGAVGVVSEVAPPDGFAGLWIEVEHGRAALAAMSRRFYGAPDENLAVVGVTGTNGKTTTVFCVDAMLRHCGRITGMVGTILYRVAGEERPAVNTTPDSLDLMRLMAEVRDAGGSNFTFEVSSHALALRRVAGLTFHTVLFTNLTRDHLDFHGTMEEYFAAKSLLFQGAGGPPPKYAVINADDAWGKQITLPAETKRLTYGLKNSADLRAENIDAGFHGLRFDVRYPGGKQHIESKLCGLINVYNLLGAFGAGLSLGLTATEIAAGLESCKAVPGRFERVDAGQPFLVVVDYAHTDDALRNTIATARALNPKRVITLFGCGGDRDRAKRPLMGQAAAELSDYVVVTSDNPRSEDPLTIINDAMVGVRRFDTRNVVEPDREKAIRLAIQEAHAGDIVLLAGKGHETYQVLRDRTIDFDDRVAARRVLESYGYAVKPEAHR